MDKHLFRVVAALFVLFAATIAKAEPVVWIKCTISPEWIAKAIESSTKTPKPTQGEVVSSFRNGGSGGIYEIEASFTDNNTPVGVGTFLGEKTGYIISEANIVFNLPELGVAALDRFKGRMSLAITSRHIVIEYVCTKQSRKF